MKIAVYGTLRKGQGNYFNVLSVPGAKMRYIRTTTLHGYTMYGSGCPMIYESGDNRDCIVVDIMEVNKEAWDFIYRLEAGSYRLSLTQNQPLKNTNNDIPIWIGNTMYFKINGTRIKHGDWCKWERKEERIYLHELA